MKTWNQVKKCIANDNCKTSYDFKEMMHSTFKIANGDSICMHEIDEGTYECYDRKYDSENYLETLETHKNSE